MKKTSIALLSALSLGLLLSPQAQATTLSAFSSGSSSGSGSSGQQAVPAPGTPWATEISDGLVVNLIGDILGEGISDHVGVLTGDLGIMTSIGTGKEFAIIFGDSFSGANFGQGEWMSPVGVVAELDKDGKIIIKRVLNNDESVEQLINYSHNDRGLTLLPSDVINVDGTLYMQAMWNEGVGNVLYTQIWKSTDQGKSWRSVSTTPASYLDGYANLLTWEQGPDGYIYMMSSEFKRADDVYLTRFKLTDFGNRNAWEHYSIYSDGSGGWGSALTPVLSNEVKAGEMSLRYIDDHWVLAMFNVETMAIEVRISKEIATDWNAITPAQVIVSGYGGWAEDQSASNFTQLYGGYIVPGSTIDNMDLVVSQWNTSDNSRYMSTQFNVKGLDTFFGLNTPAPTARSLAPQVDRSGDQSVITVKTNTVDPTTAQELATENLMENMTELYIVPLEE